MKNFCFLLLFTLLVSTRTYSMPNVYSSSSEPGQSVLVPSIPVPASPTPIGIPNDNVPYNEESN